MSQGKWVRGKPGSITGTVVPAPASDDAAPQAPQAPVGLPSFPQSRAGEQRADQQRTDQQRKDQHRADEANPLPRRRPGEHRPGPRASSRGTAGAPARQSQHEPPRLPDNVRSLFKPVLTAPASARSSPGGTIQGNPPQDLPAGAAPRNRRPGWPAQTPGSPTRFVADADIPAGSGLAGLADGPGSLRPVASSPRPVADGQAGAAAQSRQTIAGPQQPATGPSRGHRQARRGTGQGRGGQRLARLAPRAADADPRPRYGRQVVWLIALTVLALLTAAGTVVALVQLHGSGASLSADTGPAGPGGGQDGLSVAAATRAQAAAWIAREISRSSIIACDSLMCADLARAGVPSLNLMVIGPTTPDPLGADVVAATPVLRSQFGGRLASVYAPLVLASFGTGATRVDVRAVAPDGAAAYQAALRQDVAARKIFGTRLLSNSRITLPASARADLIAGRVDPRLLLTLPLLADQHPIVILGFYDQAPGAGPGVPLTGAELSASDGQATGLSPAAYRHWLVNLLLSQRAPYRAVSVRSMVDNGLPVVSVRFSRPSPFGLIHV